MTNLNLSQFIRPDILQMETYVPVPYTRAVVKLDAGENQFGFSPTISKALATAPVNYYPDPEYKTLRQALAAYVGAKPENIMVGSGSDELLDLILRLTLNRGDQVINCPPTFGMYSVLASLNQGVVVSIPRQADFSLNLSSILSQINIKTKAIIICTPNNPTGNTTSNNEIITLLKTGKLIIVDEAYFEFCGQTAFSLIPQYKNLVILRTFSKWAGIAGLRLGYAIMNSFLVDQLLKIKPPYNVNLAAEVAGIAALEDLPTTKKITQVIIKERSRLYRELNKISYLTIYPSEANFLFFKIKTAFSKLKQYLENKKIAVRYYQSDLTESAIRLTIGRPPQNDQVLTALKEF